MTLTSRMKNLVLMTFVVAIALLSSCTKKDESKKPVHQVNLAIWGNYIDPGQEKLFTESKGIKLNITNYSSNEELLAKLQAGASGYDVAVPSDYMVEIMLKMGLLEKLDKTKLKNLHEISNEFLNQAYDPPNDYSLPYAWTISGIAINRDLFKGTIKGWKDLFENKELDGKISLLDDVREAMGAALKSKGLSYNTTNPADLKKAKEVLMASRKRIKMFRSDMIDPLVNKEVAAGQAYLVDANQAWRKTDGKIEFVIPEEGTAYSIDNLVIVKGAKNVNEAHALIDFLMRPEINALFTKTIMAGPVLKKTMELLPAELKTNKSLFPSPSVLQKAEKIRDLGESTRLYDEAWTEVKSQ